MDYMFFCKDEPGSGAADLRQTFLEAHLEYIEEHMDEIAVAGPLFDESGSHMVGSCLIYRADTLAGAQLLFEGDPYFKAGIWNRVETAAFKGVAGAWVGGKTW